MNKKIFASVLFGIYLISIIGSISALTVSSVITSPEMIEPGKISKISLELDNDGEYTITDVSIILDLNEIPFAPYGSSSEASFDEIKDGRSKTTGFEIVALNTAKPGIYKIPVEITYMENDEKKTKSSLISLNVNSEPIVSIDLGDNQLIKGQEGMLEVNIVNKGLSDIKFLEVELKNSVYFNSLSSENIYIGDLNSDDFDSAEFKIFLKENSPNNVNIPMNIIYKDIFNKEYLSEENIQLRVYSKDEAKSLGIITTNNTSTYVILALVVIVAYLIYRRIRKKRKNSNKENF